MTRPAKIAKRGAFVTALLKPVPTEMRALLEQRWRSLPAELRTDQQVLGRDLVHCGYTNGAAYCSFGCTHCYLPKNANRVPLPSLAEMREQILANRRLIGPGSGLQITGGDVVDAYWQAGRSEELIEIVRYANEVGTVPMLMTHGQTLMEHPDYLDRLVVEGGLRKLGLHIDTTQAGRRGYPLRNLTSEADLHPLRERFVELILATRGRTRAPLSAAHLLTVTERNLDSVAAVMAWLVARPEHLDVFHTVSFQTETDIGRTRMSAHPVTPQRTWEQICSGLGRALPRDGLWYGHPACTSMTMLLVGFPDRQVINLVGEQASDRALWSGLFELFGGTGVSGQPRPVWWANKVSLALRNPVRVTRLAFALAARLRRDGAGLRFAWQLVRGRIRGVNLVMHNFMHEDELRQPRSALVEQRLAACSFRGAVKRDGRWVAESMCTMNAHLRAPLYAEQIARAEVKTRSIRVDPDQLATG